MLTRRTITGTFLFRVQRLISFMDIFGDLMIQPRHNGDPTKFFDPYAKAVAVPGSYCREASTSATAFNSPMKSVVVDCSAYNWEEINICAVRFLKRLFTNCTRVYQNSVQLLRNQNEEQW